MDANQFKMFLEHQTNVMRQMLQEVQASSAASQAARRQQQPSAASVQIPKPSPLSLEGDMEANFDFFEKSWHDYAKAIGMDRWPQEENYQKVSFLLTVIGEPARKKYFNFELTVEQKANPEAALKAIREKVVTKRNVIIDRLDFFSEVQSTGESIDDFVSRLKVMAKLAQLGAMEMDLVTYKVVTSNKWQHLRMQMLSMADIDLNKAVDLCRAFEITSWHSQDLDVLVPGTEVNMVQKTKSRTRSMKLQRCKFCGNCHEFNRGACPALGKRCHRCQGRNHFENACRAEVKAKHRKSNRKVKKAKDDSTSESELASSDENEEYEIGKIFDYSDHGSNVFAELELKLGKKWRPVLCDVDTGANTSLIGHASLIKLTGNRNTPLLPSSVHLQGFGGNPITVLGQVKVPCRRLGRRFILVLQVVDIDHRPLLSARASQELGLVKFCKTVNFGTRAFVHRVESRRIMEQHTSQFKNYVRGKSEASVGLEDGLSKIQQQRQQNNFVSLGENEFRRQSLVNLKLRKEPARKFDRSSSSNRSSESTKSPTVINGTKKETSPCRTIPPSTEEIEEEASYVEIPILHQRLAHHTSSTADCSCSYAT